MRTLGIVTFAAVVAGAIGACGPNRQPPPDPAALRQSEWPACINRHMKEGMDACPSPSIAEGPEPAACTQPTARPTPASAPPDFAVPEDVLAASLPLAAAYEAKTNDDAKRAQAAFTRALKTTPAGSIARVWAHLGMMQVQQQLGDHDAAMQQAMLARKVAKAANLHDPPTRAAVIATYAVAGTPASAYDNFRLLSDDGEAEDADTLVMMHELARELGRIGKLDAATVVISRAREMDPKNACLHAAKLVRIGEQQANRQATAAAVSALVDDIQKIDAADPRRPDCRREAAELLVGLANKWHDEASRTKDTITLDYAAQAHGVVLELFDQEELDAHHVCVDRRLLAHRRADLLFAQKKWNACGPAYDAALREDPRGQRGEHAALAAVTCRQQAWLDDSVRLDMASDNDRMEASIQRTDDWHGMLRSFHRFICIARDDRTQADPVQNAAFSRAAAFYEGGALWESAVAFRLLAFTPTQGIAARHAAKRYAEVMNDLATDDDDCLIELQLDLERLDQMHCGSKTQDDTCAAINTILDRIRRPIL